ncbi:MAG: MarC family NAAT transporter [Verrucomicrobiota bacterium]
MLVTPSLSLVAGSFLAAFAGLFPIVNPFGAVPLFLSLTAELGEAERRRQAALVVRNAIVIMLVSLLLGGVLLEFFGISISALRIAGGLIVAYLGFHMLFPGQSSAPVKNPHAAGKTDYTLIPLAFPSLTGAGSIAVIMGFSTKITTLPNWGEKATGYAVVALAILSVAWLSLLILRASMRVARWLNPHGMDALTRFMGLVLVCIGVQFVADGIRSFGQG